MLIRKGEPVRNARAMTVIMSTASPKHAVYPLDKALAGAVLGIEVNVVFEGAAVRLLKRGYRPRLSGLADGAFTAIVERVMKEDSFNPATQSWAIPPSGLLVVLGGSAAAIVVIALAFRWEPGPAPAARGLGRSPRTADRPRHRP